MNKLLSVLIATAFATSLSFNAVAAKHMAAAPADAAPSKDMKMEDKKDDKMHDKKHEKMEDKKDKKEQMKHEKKEDKKEGMKGDKAAK